MCLTVMNNVLKQFIYKCVLLLASAVITNFWMMQNLSEHCARTS